MRHGCLALVAASLLGAAVARGAEDAFKPSSTARAEELLRQAEDAREAERRFHLADRAALEAERVAQAEPENSTAWLFWARALAITDPTRPDVCRPVECAQAITVLERGRAADKRQVDVELFSFELGIVQSRLGRFAEALAEYDRTLRYISPNNLPLFAPFPAERASHLATVHGNAAETLMALGRLDEAIERYQKAVELAAHQSPQWGLGQWGLAVAYDRAGERARGADVAIEALKDDPAMAQLRRDEGVFFEPPGDIDYYLALAHETAFAQWGDAPEAAMARAAWRRYLGNGPVPAPGSTVARYRAVAKHHLDRIERLPAARTATPRVSVSVKREALLPLGDPLRALVEERVDELQLCQLRFAPRQPSLALIVNVDADRRFSLPPVDLGLTPELRECVEHVLAHWRARRPVEARLYLFLRFG